MSTENGKPSDEITKKLRKNVIFLEKVRRAGIGHSIRTLQIISYLGQKVDMSQARHHVTKKVTK